MEASATILAASTILIGSLNLNLPTWGIFLGWAATSLSGKLSRATAAAIARTLFGGAVCALAALSLQGALQAHLGNAFPSWTAAMLAIVTVNPLIILLGRLRAFSAIPVMFVGFSTVFATYHGHFGTVPGNPVSAFFWAITMNVVGIGFSWAAVAMTRTHNGPAKVTNRRARPGIEPVDRPQRGSTPQVLTEPPATKHRL
ncbi:DUF1097 domain-containing protein [Paeniglutamicibacter sp. MACA_103]|uniref:DUF1097 domain-containing protein n=1 Tax=Paeniglutamicibacter sp. MACA_103 TaxID=3377337 RepID=UPI003892D7C8